MREVDTDESWHALDALVDAVKRLLSDAALRLRLGTGARRTVADMTWRATAERTLDVYRAAIARVRG